MNCKKCGKEIREPYEAGENVIIRVVGDDIPEGAIGIVEPYCRKCIELAGKYPDEFGILYIEEWSLW